ncbi:MAG: TRAP transporter TatT component family protein [Vicinamibacterales bacterium]
MSDAVQTAGDPDTLYRERERPEAALEAERLWAARLAAHAGDFEAAWKLARIRYWLGTNGPADAAGRKAVLEAGIAAARLAQAARPDAPDGHFWLAANMGALADAHGLRQGMRYRTPIREALEHARRLAPEYLDGSPDRALGRWYYKVPRLFGGDLRRSETHLRAALRYNAHSIISLYFLAETLVGLKRQDEARQTLETLLATPSDPDWTPEDTRFKTQARELLASLR